MMIRKLILPIIAIALLVSMPAFADTLTGTVFGLDSPWGPAWGPASAFDGNLDTSYAKQFPGCVGLMFAAPVVLTGVNMVPRNEWGTIRVERLDDIVVAASSNTTDGFDGDWTTLFTVAGSVPGWNNFTISDPGSYTAVRFYKSGSVGLDPEMDVAEIRVLGSVANVPEPGSMLALAGGLASFAGMALRRRK